MRPAADDSTLRIDDDTSTVAKQHEPLIAAALVLVNRLLTDVEVEHDSTLLPWSRKFSAGLSSPLRAQDSRSQLLSGARIFFAISSVCGSAGDQRRLRERVVDQPLGTAVSAISVNRSKGRAMANYFRGG
jgi:hypothetical protein